MNTPNFPISPLKSPKDAGTFEVCCRQTFGKPSPLLGRQIAVPRREACTPAAQMLVLHAVLNVGITCILSYPTILTTSLPKKLENSATKNTTVFYASPTAAVHPTPIHVIHRATYDTFTGHAKDKNRKIYDIQVY